MRTLGILLGIGAVITFALMVWATIDDDKQWAAFSVAHHCKIVGKTQSSALNGLSSNGKITVVFVPETTGYACDDGVTYWRDN